MKDRQEYEFWIDAFSPKDIPMQRLGEYMTQLGRLLGEKDSVHFHELRPGSTTIAFEVEWEAVPKLHSRIESVKRVEAANDATSAQTQLNEMLRQDNAVGDFRRVLPTGPESILRLPGRENPKPEKIGPFSEPAIVKGELIRLEGEDATKHAGIRDSVGRLWAGEMSRELAVEMRAFLFEWVRVEGTARWIRNEDGAWDLKGFQIHTCKLLPKDSLEDDIAKLRDIAGSQWKEMQDPLGYVRELRNDDDEIH